jgi:hypothetical protein
MDTTTILLYVLIFCVVVLIAWNIKNELRLRAFLKGKNAESLEGILAETIKEVGVLKEHDMGIIEHIQKIDQRLLKSIRNIEVLRFNPFAEQGSNQSFAIALLNDDADGVIISSLYSRDHVSVFAKPIKNGVSTYELSKEESEVLAKSISHTGARKNSKKENA